MAYWLMKSEPDVYGIEHLKSEGETIWDGIRNYQARNLMRDMKIGDLAFFYHSNTKPPGIAGLMKVSKLGLDDPTQFDPQNKYYDPKSTPENPRWQTVALEYVETFPTYLTLNTLREQFEPEDLLILRRGNRLSITPVADDVAEQILKLVGSVR
ncbi:MAG: EVE domain-containing protein [Cyanobacteria bacterium P01_E01_bin.6]